MADISIEHVRKAYGAVTVLHDFDLHIEDGEFVVFVGPSGCGKSTMLKIIAGLEDATEGRILIGGSDVTDRPPGERDIAMVFQNYALYPHLTVGGNMGFGLKMRGAPTAEIKRRVNEAAALLGVDHLLDRRPRQLSGGQRQRVALGRAIVREPKAFLMDEPLSNLDAKLRVQMRAEISALHRRLNVTTVYVTHDQTEAMTMADRIVILRDGMIQQIADPDTMFHRPANLFVASFIGSPGMNLLSVKPVIEGGSVLVDLFGTRVALPVDPSRIERLDGGPLALGLRPEHVKAGPGGVSFTQAPTMVESLGSEKYVYVSVPPENRLDVTDLGDGRRAEVFITRLIEPGEIQPGTKLSFSFDPARLHMFDVGTGEAL